jgi:hypothetical protein
MNKCEEFKSGRLDRKLTMAEREKEADRIIGSLREISNWAADLAQDIEILRVHHRRASPIRKPARRKRRITMAVGQAVKAYAAAHPDMPFDEIGNVHGISNGSVARILRDQQSYVDAQGPALPLGPNGGDY